MEWLFVVGAIGVAAYAVITSRTQPDSQNNSNDVDKKIPQLQSIHIKCQYCDKILIEYDENGKEQVKCNAGYGSLGTKQEVLQDSKCYDQLPCGASYFVHYYYGGNGGNHWPDQQHLEVPHPHIQG